MLARSRLEATILVLSKGENQRGRDCSSDPYDPDLDLEVEACDDHQFRGDQLYMHIRWTGYSEDEATWEPIEGLTTCAETIAQYLHQLQNRQPKEYTALLGSLPTFIKKLIPKRAPAKTKKAKPTKDVPLQVRDKPTDGHAPAAKAKCTSPVPLLNPDHTPPIPPPTTTRPEEQANQPVMRELLVQSLLEAAPPPPSMPKFTSIPTFQQLQPMLIETITQARRVPSLPPNQWKPAAEAAWRVYLRSVPSLIDTAVKSRDKRLLFNALWDVLTAHRALSPLTLGRDRVATTTQSGARLRKFSSDKRVKPSKSSSPTGSRLQHPK